MSGSNNTTETRREPSLEIDDNISMGIDDVRGFMSDFFSGTEDRGQSTVMGILNRNDRSNSTSDDPTAPQGEALQDREDVIRHF